MTTLGEIIENIRFSLEGYGAQKDAVSSLTNAVNSTDTTFGIDDSDIGAARGLAEIDFELVRVKTVDIPSRSVALYPFGRGYRGTARATHAAGAEIRFNPSWPAVAVAQKVNSVLHEMYPDVYSVKIYETTMPSQGAIDVPDDCVGIISVWASGDTADDWFREDRWSWEPDSTSIDKPLRVGGYKVVGDKIRVVYAARPQTFDLSGSLTQDFEAVTGLEERHLDLLSLGVAARMAPFIDVAKLPFLAAEARSGAEASSQSAARDTTRLLMAIFQQRLQQESAVLKREHPIRVHRTGVI